MHFSSQTSHPSIPPCTPAGSSSTQPHHPINVLNHGLKHHDHHKQHQALHTEERSPGYLVLVFQVPRLLMVQMTSGWQYQHPVIIEVGKVLLLHQDSQPHSSCTRHASGWTPRQGSHLTGCTWWACSSSRIQNSRLAKEATLINHLIDIDPIHPPSPSPGCPSPWVGTSHPSKAAA